MNEEAKTMRDLKRALGPLPDIVWDIAWNDLIVEEIIDMHHKGTLEIDDPEASWETLKKEAQKAVERAKRHVSEILERMKLAKGSTYGEDRDDEWRWAPVKVSPDDRVPLDESTGDETVVEAFLDYFLFIDPKNEAMLRATSAFFGWLANQHPRVVLFRNRILGGGTLTPDKARKLMGSYAARFLPLEWFLDWGIPVVDHTSEIVGEYDWGSHRDAIDHRVTVRVHPPGVTERVRYAHPDTPILDEDQVSARCMVTKKGRGVVPPYSVELPDDPEETKPTSLPPPILLGNYQTPTRPTTVWPGSVVDNIYKLSEELADTFRWPGKDAAAEFVLTGIAPSMRPVDARLYKGGEYLGSPSRIELAVSPWVSTEEVARAYRRLQERVVEGSRNRLPGRKTLEVARFVWEQERLHGYERPSWPVLCERWNEDHPEHRFEEWRYFRMYFTRADKAVKELNFDRPWFNEEGSPEE